jgi:hypothetical protein
MGGSGSGNRWRLDTKSTTEDYRPLDVRRLARFGVLAPGSGHSWQWTCNDVVIGSIQIRAEHDRIVLTYRHRSNGDAWTDKQYPVTVVRTPCNLGGTRPWFICPGRGCGRRVAILYGGGIFACRQCYQLTHASSRENFSDRAARRADRIRVRLGWEPGILNGEDDKPKWMRWRTFERLQTHQRIFANRSVYAMAAHYGWLGGRSIEDKIQRK